MAEQCYWFGRYVERAESMARMLAVTRNVALDAELSPEDSWRPVLSAAGVLEEFSADCGVAACADGEAVEKYLTWDERNITSLRRTVATARENARSVREVVSRETWECVNELHLWLSGDSARALFSDHRLEFYRRIRESSQLCQEFMRSTMLHDTPLDFVSLGILVERAGQTARVLDVHLQTLTRLGIPPSEGTSLWLSVLRVCLAMEPFLKVHRGRVDGDEVAAFLILDPRFPRSIRFCLHNAYKRFSDIRPPAEYELPGIEAGDRLQALNSWLTRMRPDDVKAASAHQLLLHVDSEIARVNDDIGFELFGYAPPARPAARAEA